jgi:rRNA processing protein Krr1/Pno1
MEIETAAAAFVLGRGGSTKRKVERVSECRMDLDERRGTIEIRGTKANRQRARDYVNFIDQQRQGSVTVDIDGRGDLTVVEVPEDCCGFVMGRGGNTLRSMEEEWGTLMCFATVDGREKLCIFGKFKARRGAELKVMSALEHKRPGHCVDRDEILFSKRVKGDVDDEGWAVDTKLLSDDDFSYALGSKGSTRRKLAAAAGACLASLIGFAAAYCASLPSHRIHRLRRLRD